MHPRPPDHPRRLIGQTADDFLRRPGADRLDAVLCLMQAAWAQAQHQAGATRWGLSPDLDPVEGWILTA